MNQEAIDTAVLQASLRGVTYYTRPSKAAAQHMQGLRLDDRLISAAIGRLECNGYVAPMRPHEKRRNRDGVPYTITDAGRAEYRRRAEIPDLTVDQARVMHTVDLEQLYSDLPLVRRQLDLRRAGATRVRGVLHTLNGRGYEGTHGWHIIAFAAPGGLLGFVNTAHGHAVLTDVQLDVDTIEALTTPGQPEGPQASGAAAWTAPDVGEAKNAQAPRGWVQLVVDLRGKATPVPCITAYVCAWGLRTCYQGRRGAPGQQALEGRNELAAAEWPLTPEARTRMRAAAEPIARDFTLRLAALAERYAEITAALGDGPLTPSTGCAAWGAACVSWLPMGYDPSWATRSALTNEGNQSIKEALKRSGITHVCDHFGEFGRNALSGARYWDVCVQLLAHVLRAKLNPVAEALWASLLPHALHDTEGTVDCRHLALQTLQPMIAALVPHTADTVLRELSLYDALGCSALTTIHEALYAGDYLEVNVPVVMPELFIAEADDA